MTPPTATMDAREIRELDKAHVWHPFTNARSLDASPLDVLSSAEGCTVTDADGKTYIDAMAGLWCVNIGYGRKEVADAAYQQLLRLPYAPLSLINEPAARLAGKLTSMLPEGLGHVWFVNSGSEANDTVIKIVRNWGAKNGGRYKIIARYQGYHGGTLGATSLTGQTHRRSDFGPLLPGIIHVQAPYFFRSSARSEEELAERCAEELDATIRYEKPGTVAAFIAEPVIGGGGVIPPPADYLQRMREVCDRHGVLMVLDEVITGFGRTGQLFAAQTYGVTPDIMSMAKGLSSAYLPIGAVAVNDKVFDALNPEDGSFFAQINTYGGHPACCAAALKNLEILTGEDLPANARKVGPYLGGKLKKLSDIPCVGDVRGVGLIWGVELVQENGDPLPTADTAKILKYAHGEGVLFAKNAGIADGPANTVTISPPLILKEEEADKIADALEKALRRFQSER